MNINTIESGYEYRIANLVRDVIKNEALSDDYMPDSGSELEMFLNDNRHALANALMDDINVWMGFDALLDQIKAKLKD